MNVNYKQILESLQKYNVNYIIIGSHALYLLNLELKLNIDIDLSKKDLDIIVLYDENAFLLINDFSLQKHENKNITCYKLFYSKSHRVDLITKANFTHMKINKNFIPYLNYENIQNHCNIGNLYDHNIKYINIEAYYGIVKSTGLAKYITIIKQILEKYPNLKDTVIA